MRSLKIGLRSIEYILIAGCLFFAAMNFYAKFFYFVFIGFFLLVLLNGKLRLNLTSVPYLLLGVLMALYNADEGLLPMLRPFAYIFGYLIGFNLLMNIFYCPLNAERKIFSAEKRGFELLGAIALGSFVHFMLNFALNFSGSAGRNTEDIWTGEPLSATIQAAVASVMIGFAVSLIICPVKKTFRYFGCLAVGGILLYNLKLASRTILVMLFLVFLIGILYYYFDVKSKSFEFKFILGLFVFSVASVLIFTLNLGGLRDYVYSSNFFGRFSEIGELFVPSERMRRKILFLRNMLNYPFGGLNMRAMFGYAHGLFLDGYDEYGIAGLILLVFILFSGLRGLIAFCKNEKFSLAGRLCFLCVYSAVLLEFSVEPILEAVPWLFVCYCLLNGCIDGMNKVHSIESEQEGSSV